MSPEDRDLLLRTGKVTSRGLADPQDYDYIAPLCTEECASGLFSNVVRSLWFLDPNRPVANVTEGWCKTAMKRSARFLDVFVEKRLSLTDCGIVCSKDPPLDRKPSDFTTLAWKAGLPHCEIFPHLILLVEEKDPRVYSVLSMDPVYMEREDTAFELARLFSIYAEIDLCLVLDPERCVYIRKDGTYKRSPRRPTGGAVAHSSTTGPGLYQHHLGPLRAAFSEQPELFKWSDDFGSDSSFYTGAYYVNIEQIAILEESLISQMKAEVQRVADEFVTLAGNERNRNEPLLRQCVQDWFDALRISRAEVRVITNEDLPMVSANPLSPPAFFAGSLYKVLDAALDVMEVDLKRAGLLELVNILLQPLYTASHIGYLRLVQQSARWAGAADNDTLWKRIQGQILPASVSSLVTLARLEAWRRIEHLYRGLVPPVDTVGGTYKQAQEVLSTLPLFKRINENGPIWIWERSENVCVMPAVVVRLDENEELHCEEGPAIIDPDGTEQSWTHGEEQY